MSDGITKANIKVVAVLKEPTGVYEDLVPVRYKEGGGHASVYQFIGAVQNTRGFIRELGEGHVEVIPMERVHSYTVQLVDIETPSGIITDGVGNLAALQQALKVQKR